VSPLNASRSSIYSYLWLCPHLSQPPVARLTPSYASSLLENTNFYLYFPLPIILYFNAQHQQYFSSHTYFHFLSLDVYKPFIYFSPCIIILPPIPPYLVRLQLLPAVFYSINCLISLYFAVLMHSLIGSSLPFTTISDNI
jgi:hypothetical protein